MAVPLDLTVLSEICPGCRVESDSEQLRVPLSSIVPSQHDRSVDGSEPAGAGARGSERWDDLGPTNLNNLVPLCTFHHHRAHEGRWQLQLDASSRQLTVRLADGSPHSQAFPDLLEQQRPAT